jgi:hypothetical protein
LENRKREIGKKERRKTPPLQKTNAQGWDTPKAFFGINARPRANELLLV